MNSGSWCAKSIIELAEVARQVDLARQRYSGFEQAWDGLTWLLARRAEEIGQPFRGYRIYKVQGSQSSIVVPNIIVLYDVLDHAVEIIAVRVTEPVIDIEDLSF